MRECNIVYYNHLTINKGNNSMIPFLIITALLIISFLAVAPALGLRQPLWLPRQKQNRMKMVERTIRLFLIQAINLLIYISAIRD